MAFVFEMNADKPPRLNHAVNITVDKSPEDAFHKPEYMFPVMFLEVHYSVYHSLVSFSPLPPIP